ATASLGTKANAASATNPNTNKTDLRMGTSLIRRAQPGCSGQQNPMPLSTKRRDDAGAGSEPKRCPLSRVKADIPYRLRTFCGGYEEKSDRSLPQVPGLSER